ncbi:phosphoribosylformylglycinamidine synthase subunit PurL [Spirochaeta africana]|uniref:Phosphoribosylformylglycinamidine synthase subunit PurL n=1 Tax=Spirochaeta africana (strain ATCC 700263 / DSM 8902 / Z-7692) TaxID=889378 RepID=H9UFA4_SPIAZ|nr:AIR synthase-related protein [Spirochaeta africana]AFG36197.1 phosphoribosylformylglycinamidine (FGAM) synthase, synthetase domain protein [Spirochaeta africana DSM 8902]
MRIEVQYRQEDPRAERVRQGIAASVGVQLPQLHIADVYLLEAASLPQDQVLAQVFTDPVAQELRIGGFPADGSLILEVGLKPGVTDTTGITAAQSLQLHGAVDPVVQTAVQYRIPADSVSGDQLAAVVAYLHNPLIQNARVAATDGDAAKLPQTIEPVPAADVPPVERVQLEGLDEQQLLALSRQRLLALSVPEMQAIQEHFADAAVKQDRVTAGIGAEATDVELEMLAQTWSEHCKHKIFAADVQYHDTVTGESSTIHGLFKSCIAAVTRRIADRHAAEGRDFLRSVFTDNAGVIAFNDDYDVCIKAETHNSPSALDPYGGAITGIVGVNRDILGTGMGARPILNTNVLCFGYPDTPDERVPQGLMHPNRVMHGVHHGIVDGGNQSGIPVVGGAFLFDNSYLGKPLVFCGTGGIMPRTLHGKPGWQKEILPGDFAVMVGGRIGKDGIHGATFSSEELSESSPTSAVQIGDPIIQKRMTEFLLDARDRGLYRSLTDNGAGGLSSSFGEMAEGVGGIYLNLDNCPLKYPGLAAWEIFVSESQERMSLAVQPENWEALANLAREYDVEVSHVGEFRNSGLIEIEHQGAQVCRLPLEFVHDGVPRMQIPAEWIPPRDVQDHQVLDRLTAAADLAHLQTATLTLLQDPVIASKEHLIRQYDHEVQGGSVVKPFTGPGMDGVSDGGVVQPLHESTQGISMTHGVCPRYSDIDTYAMAQCAVDEAYRAHIALGGDPDRAGALDNFCWPDPVLSDSTPDGPYKMAQLVRSCRGLYDICDAYNLPLVSGKDSMKNDARLAGRKVSVRPTLLVTLMGIVPDVTRCRNTDFQSDGDEIYLVGTTAAELGGSRLEAAYQEDRLALPGDAGQWRDLREQQNILYEYDAIQLGDCPRVDTGRAHERYLWVAEQLSCGLIATIHDLSDGGLAAALAEGCIGGRIGARIDLPGSQHPVIELFSESASRFVVTVPPEHRQEFAKAAAGRSDVLQLGTVTEEPLLRINSRLGELLFGLEQLQQAFFAMRSQDHE